MTQVIEVPGQGPVEFPDDMNDEQITAAIKRSLLQAPNAQQRRMGVREPRVKDEQLMGNIMKAPEQIGYDAGGWVTDKTGSPLAGMATNMAASVAFDPLTYVGFGAGKLMQPALESGAKKVMWSALKPNKAARQSGDAAKAVETLLKEGANVTEGGVAKLTGHIDELDDALDVAIKSSSARLAKTDALKSLKGVLAEYRAGTLAEDSLPKIRAVAAKLIDHPSLRGSQDMSIQTAQAMKRMNYKELGDKAFGMGLRPQAERDALKAVTHDLKVGIERAVPEAGAINAEMSPLINARNLAQDRVLVSMNKDPLSFGAFGISNPKAAALWLAQRSELAKSLLARFLYSGAAPAAPVAGAGVGAGIGELMQQQGQQ